MPCRRNNLWKWGGGDLLDANGGIGECDGRSLGSRNTAQPTGHSEPLKVSNPRSSFSEDPCEALLFKNHYLRTAETLELEASIRIYTSDQKDFLIRGR